MKDERVAEGINKYVPKHAMKLRTFSHFCCRRGVAIFTKKINLNLKRLTTKKVDKPKKFFCRN